MIYPITKSQARRIWLAAQRLDQWAPFGDGADATRAAVEHLGYVQIDTINVIERCHHHILYTRIPGYQRTHFARRNPSTSRYSSTGPTRFLACRAGTCASMCGR